MSEAADHKPVEQAPASSSPIKDTEVTREEVKIGNAKNENIPEDEATKPVTEKPEELKRNEISSPTGATDDTVDVKETEAVSEKSDKEKALELKSQGNDALKESNFDKALDLYTQAIELDPTNHIFYSNRSATYQRKKDLEAALADAQKCVEIEPNWAKGYVRMVHPLVELDELEEAQKYLKIGIQKDTQKTQAKFFKDIQATIERKLCYRFFKLLKGKWNGLVSAEMGGYEQQFDFKSATQCNVSVMGREVSSYIELGVPKTSDGLLANPLNYYHLDLTVEFDERTQAQIGRATERVMYIAKLEKDSNGNELLWLCSTDPANGTTERPTNFNGPTVVQMSRGPIKQEDNEEVKKMDRAEKIKGYLSEALLIFPPNARLMPVDGDSEEDRVRISLLNVKFQSDNYKISVKYGEQTEVDVRNLLLKVANPSDFGSEVESLIAQLRVKMQAALLLPPDSEIATFADRQKDYEGSLPSADPSAPLPSNTSQTPAPQTSGETSKSELTKEKKKKNEFEWDSTKTAQIAVIGLSLIGAFLAGRYLMRNPRESRTE